MAGYCPRAQDASLVVFLGSDCGFSHKVDHASAIVSWISAGVAARAWVLSIALFVLGLMASRCGVGAPGDPSDKAQWC